MSRPIQAVIHSENLRHNLALMRRLARGRTLWAVVKANAYGHGLAAALQAFAEADGLATLEVCDARCFRDHGWQKRILLLEGFFDADELTQISRLGVEVAVHSAWQMDLLRKTPLEKGIDVHVKINSGMNRLGFAPEAFASVKAELEAIDGVRVLGCVTHFANAEKTYAPDGILPVARQLGAMGELAGRKDACMANSGGLLFHEEVAGGGG
ncbi:MAG: alanine racemase, partial [Duodenibacillus sp.]